MDTKDDQMTLLVLFRDWYINGESQREFIQSAAVASVLRRYSHTQAISFGYRLSRSLTI